MNLTSIKKYVAECIGTMVLVIFGCGTAMLTGPGSSGAAYIATALAFGLTIVAMAYSVGNISGCRINPAVSFGVFITGGISLKNLRDYLSCPVIAACGGSYMVTVELIDNNRWDEITELCKKSREIVEEARA